MPTASGTARRRLSFNGHTLQAASGMFHAAQKIVRRIGSSEPAVETGFQPGGKMPPATAGKMPATTTIHFHRL